VLKGDYQNNHYLESGVAVLCCCCCGGYPELPKGQVITGIEQAEAQGAVVFHAGTQQEQQLVTDGGRVLPGWGNF